MIDECNIDSRIEGGDRVAFSKEMFRGLSPADFAHSLAALASR
jgi:hypothetical protein